MRNRLCNSMILCLLICWSGFSQAQDLRSVEDKEQYRAVKCGRNSVFHICQTLGVNVELDEIDRELGYEPIVSFASLRKVLESHGLFCRSLRLNLDNLELVTSVLQEPGHRRSAIVTLHALNADEQHYTVLLNATPKRLTVWDAGLAQAFDVPFAGTLHVGAPVILIGTDSSILMAIDSEHKSLSHFVRSIISSWFLAAGQVMVLCLWSWRALETKRIGMVNAIRSLVGGRLGCFAAFAFRPRMLLGVGAGASLLLGIHHVIRIEMNPLLAEVSVLDLGAKPIGSVQTASFRVENRSLWRTHELKNVRTSCSCLTPEVDRLVIPPRSSATVRIKVMVLSDGDSENHVLVTPNTRGIPEFAVKIRHAGYEATRLAPAYVAAGGFPQGVTEKKDVSLMAVNFEGQPVPIRVAEGNVMSEGISASVFGSGLLAADENITLRIFCSGQRSLGAFSEKIMLSTIEDQPRSFFVVVHGHIVSSITIKPSVLFLQAGTKDQVQQETLTIHSRVGDLEFAEIDSNCDSLSVRLLPDSSANGIRRILVEHNGNTSVTNDARIRISVRNPLQAEFEIPVYSTTRDGMSIPSAAE